MSKKKILYLHAGAELYGADIVLLELLKGIDKNKFEPYVLLPNEGALVEKISQENIKVEVLNYPIIRRSIFNPGGIIRYIKDYIKYSKKIVDFIKKNNIDLVHVNTSAVLLGYYINKKTNVKIVSHIHEILTKPKFISKQIYKIINKSSDEVVCVSNAVKNNFYKFTKREDIKVIYNGVDNKKFNPFVKVDYLKKEFKLKNNDLVVGMIGRINAIKGQMDFIKAMEIVCSKKENVKGLMVGGTFKGQEWRKEQLQKYINNSSFCNNFILEDFREDSPNIQNLIDIYVLPSVGADSLPTVVLEAMACGKPIVAYELGGVCEMVIEKYNGFFVKVGDYEKLAQRIICLLDDYKLRVKMGNNSLKRQEQNFSVQMFIYNFEQLYLKTLEDKLYE